MGCRITFHFVNTICQAFDITPSSDLIPISRILATKIIPDYGKAYEIPMLKGVMVEICSIFQSVAETGGQVTVAFQSQATGGSNSTLVDATQSWPENLWFGAGLQLVIVAGSGNGNVVTILSNTSDTLTFAPQAFTIDSTSQYAIVLAYQQIGSTTPIIFTPWQDATYTVEVGSVSSWAPSWGRGSVLMQNPSIAGIGVPLLSLAGACYDSARNVFWALDSGDNGYLVKVDMSGNMLSRTALPSSTEYSAILYSSGADELALSRTDNTIVVMDPATATLKAIHGPVFSIGGFCNIYRGAIAGGKAYFCVGHGAPGGDFVGVVNAGTWTEITNIFPIGFFPNSLRFGFPMLCPADSNMWVGLIRNLAGNQRIYVIDPTTDAVVHDVSLAGVGFGPVDYLAYAQTTGFVYAPAQIAPMTDTERGIVAVNPATYAMDHTIPVQDINAMAGMVFNPIDGFLYLGTSSWSGEMSHLLQFDLAAESVTNRWLCGPDADEVLVSPASSVIGISTFASGGNCFQIHKP